jgi:hypothetical protein
MSWKATLTEKFFTNDFDPADFDPADFETRGGGGWLVVFAEKNSCVGTLTEK